MHSSVYPSQLSKFHHSDDSEMSFIYCPITQIKMNVENEFKNINKYCNITNSGVARGFYILTVMFKRNILVCIC